MRSQSSSNYATHMTDSNGTELLTTHDNNGYGDGNGKDN